MSPDPWQDTAKDHLPLRLLTIRWSLQRPCSCMPILRPQNCEQDPLQQLWCNRWPVCDDSGGSSQTQRFQVNHLQDERHQPEVNRKFGSAPQEKTPASPWRAQNHRLQNVWLPYWKPNKTAYGVVVASQTCSCQHLAQRWAVPLTSWIPQSV